MTKGRYYSGVIAAVAVLAAFACGCGGQGAVDPSGSLVSEAGQIAFTRVTKFNDTDIESDICVGCLGHALLDRRRQVGDRVEVAGAVVDFTPRSLTRSETSASNSSSPCEPFWMTSVT